MASSWQRLREDSWNELLREIPPLTAEQAAFRPTSIHPSEPQGPADPMLSIHVSRSFHARCC